MDAPLALYRRYRPDTFTEVVGQAHVTEPLRQALRNNRVHHAYLFSGPRGCGKTTSARILARCLNCEEGPVPDPCGKCQSCVDLARGGPGTIDVIEIDAASHGGVDDARDLRERAFFAPVAARYKIYIVDEAHMVTPQGFNALLKLVEEPPEHLKFVFATTEPDKVIGTIRSRTHHYPFRLVPPKTLQDYLAGLCDAEGVRVEPAVLPLVVRAGGGSVRDSLSVLDQLIGGAGPDGVTYESSVALLGYTPDTLLDDVVDAFAARDAAEVFGVVDRVIESGQDPKRFAEDLLRRLRDLVIVAAVPDAASRGLLEGPPDQAERYAGQAARFGTAELTRAADVVNGALTEMRGATAPRLHLELLCARVLLPGADDTSEGLHARLDRIERRLAMPDGPSTTPGAGRAEPADADPGGADPGRADPGSVSGTERSRAENGRGEDRGGGRAGAGPGVPDPEPTSADRGGSAPSTAAPGSWGPVPERAPPTDTASAETSPVESPRTWSQRDGSAAAEPPEAETPVTEGPGSAGPAAAGPGGFGLADVRRLWPDILEAVKSKRRFTWIMLSQNAQVTDFRNDVLTLALVNAGARESFGRSGSDDILRQALADVAGVDCRVEAVVDSTAGTGGAQPGAIGPGSGSGSRGAGTSHESTGSTSDPAAGTRPATSWDPPTDTGPRQPPDTGTATGTGTGEDADLAADAAPDRGWEPGQDSGAPARAGGRPRQPARRRGTAEGAATPDDHGAGAASRSEDRGGPDVQVDPDGEVDPDGDVALDNGETQTELLAREFGAQVIEERDDP